MTAERGGSVVERQPLIGCVVVWLVLVMRCTGVRRLIVQVDQSPLCGCEEDGGRIFGGNRRL